MFATSNVVAKILQMDRRQIAPRTEVLADLMLNLARGTRAQLEHGTVRRVESSRLTMYFDYNLEDESSMTAGAR